MSISVQDREDLKTAEALSPLRKLHAFEIYLAIIRHHRDEAVKLALTPAVSEQQMLVSEQKKGAIVAFDFCLGVIGNIMSHADEIKKRVNPEDYE